MHESMHSFRRESPKDYRLIRNFVVDYLYASGHDVMKMADNVKINYGDRLTTNEDCIEEIVCNSIMAIAGDESAMKKALQVAKAEESILDKLANAIKNLAGKIKNFILTHTTNEAAKTFVKDVEALDKLAEMFSNAADNIKAKSEEVITNEQKNNTGKGVENVKYSIDKHFAEKYDKWDKKSRIISFSVGSTSSVLRKLGVDNKKITWDSSKIIKIKNKHPEMTDSIIKQVPNILENPIIVMESNTVSGRLVLFGDVYDSKNNPVLVALELNPTDKGGKSLNIIKIASAYGKDVDLQGFINKSKILYVEPNKERTHTWLKVNRLKLPLLSSSTYGFFNNSISQNSKKVNTKNNTGKGVDIKYSISDDVIKKFEIENINDYVHVQKQVLSTLNAENFFDDEGGKSKTVINKDSGMVIVINKKGIKETFNNKNYFNYSRNLKLAKLASIRKIPELIENGKLILDDEKNYHRNNSSIKYAYIVCETKINGKNANIKITVRKSPQNNKF